MSPKNKDRGKANRKNQRSSTVIFIQDSLSMFVNSLVFTAVEVHILAANLSIQLNTLVQIIIRLKSICSKIALEKSDLRNMARRTIREPHSSEISANQKE